MAKYAKYRYEIDIYFELNYRFYLHLTSVFTLSVGVSVCNVYKNPLSRCEGVNLFQSRQDIRVHLLGNAFQTAVQFHMIPMNHFYVIEGLVSRNDCFRTE